VALLILACLPPMGLTGEKPAAEGERGLVKVEVQGKLVKKGNGYCVQAKDPDFDTPFLVELVRTEDKNRNLDKHLQSLEGQVVILRGVLRFVQGRLDGPELGVRVKSEEQVQKAKE
jgi:hypothetical protein